MAAMHEEEVPEARECANCGAVDDLLLCSRCHTAWFCGPKCQKAYWPFHKADCKRNEFADVIEAQEPKFARFLRKHGKQAQLKDDEVDRIERASKAASGVSRTEVMDSMYGRLDPKPKDASYSAEDRIRMRQQEEADKAEARTALIQGKEYMAIEVPRNLGLDCQQYKWRQNQSHVEVFIPLPAGVPTSKVHVELTTTSLAVSVDEMPLLTGKLYQEIKRDESTWYMQARKDVESRPASESFWRAVLQNAPPHETLALEFPPSDYYFSHCEGLPKKQAPLRLQPGAQQKQRQEAAAAGLGVEAAEVAPSLAIEAA
ncbi:hypothetical protein N2152v2_008339 [Parachlorella kessleri]